jgi:hypothetical protein
LGRKRASACVVVVVLQARIVVVQTSAFGGGTRQVTVTQQRKAAPRPILRGNKLIGTRSAGLRTRSVVADEHSRGGAAKQPAEVGQRSGRLCTAHGQQSGVHTVAPTVQQRRREGAVKTRGERHIIAKSAQIHCALSIDTIAVRGASRRAKRGTKLRTLQRVSACCICQGNKTPHLATLGAKGGT